jgi:hypothetical protein
MKFVVFYGLEEKLGSITVGCGEVWEWKSRRVYKYGKRRSGAEFMGSGSECFLMSLNGSVCLTSGAE